MWQKDAVSRDVKNKAVSGSSENYNHEKRGQFSVDVSRTVSNLIRQI